MPNNDYGKDIKVEISFNEMCRVIAKVTTKLFADKIKKGTAENAD